MHVEKWIIPNLGQAKLKQLKADDIDAWLDVMAEVLASSSVKRLGTGAPLELIADLVGHASTTTTATVYRHRLRPVMTKGADLLDGAFAKSLLDEPEDKP